MGNVLSVKNLNKTYHRGWKGGKVVALNNVGFSIPNGVITGFLGANGAGKTTTMKCLLQLAFADSGEFDFFGNGPLNSEAKKRIGFLPERPYFYEYLTGAEFLKFYAELSQRLSKAEMKDRIAKLLKRVGLEHAAARPLRSYSKGMLQRIGIAQALVHRPDLVILDEPMSGLDPDGRFEVQSIIQETAKEGTAVFFSSHLLNDAEKICRRVVILKKGQMIYEGETNELIRRAAQGYYISWSGDSGLQSQVVADEIELQKQIDSLRTSRKTIVEIRLNQKSLEEIFVQMAIRS